MLLHVIACKGMVFSVYHRYLNKTNNVLFVLKIDLNRGK